LAAADDAARGAREDGVLALGTCGVDEAAIRLHVHEPDTLGLAVDPVD
jgi:hypothetical protein